MIIKQLKDKFVFRNIEIKYEINFIRPSSYETNYFDYPKELGRPSGIRVFINYNYSKMNKIYNERILLDESIINTNCSDIKTHEHRQSMADNIFYERYNKITDEEIKSICEYKIKLKILQTEFE